MADTFPIPQLKPGLYHRAKSDTLEVRLAPGPATSPLEGTPAQDEFGTVRVRLHRDDDGRLVAIVVLNASKAVPAALLQGRAEPTPPPGPLEKEPASWFVPLFAGADLVAQRFLPLADGTATPAVSVALSPSGRVAAFVVSDAATQLPDDVTSPRADG
jgi:hypothetical protein